MNKEAIKSSKLFLINLKKKINIVFEKVKMKVSELWSGKSNFNNILYFWGVIPGIFILLFQNRINSISNIFISKTIYLLLIIYFLWHLIVIKRTLKAQPDLVAKKIKEKELFEGKTKEQVKEIKKQIGRDRLKKALLLKAWDTSPNYILISAFDLLIALTQIQGLLN